MDAEVFRAWIVTAAEVIEANRDHLTQLDAAIGDADHGINLARGFAAVARRAGRGAPGDARGDPDPDRQHPDLQGRRRLRPAVRHGLPPGREVARRRRRRGPARRCPPRWTRPWRACSSSAPPARATRPWSTRSRRRPGPSARRSRRERRNRTALAVAGRGGRGRRGGDHPHAGAEGPGELPRPAQRRPRGSRRRLDRAHPRRPAGRRAGRAMTHPAATAGSRSPRGSAWARSTWAIASAHQGNRAPPGRDRGRGAGRVRRRRRGTGPPWRPSSAQTAGPTGRDRGHRRPDRGRPGSGHPGRRGGPGRRRRRRRDRCGRRGPGRAAGRAADPDLAARDDVRQVARGRGPATCGDNSAAPPPAGEFILVRREVDPADLIRLADAGLAGAVSVSGGASSHAAIIARGLGLPMVAGVDPAVLEPPTGIPPCSTPPHGELVVDPARPELILPRPRRPPPQQPRSATDNLRRRRTASRSRCCSTWPRPPRPGWAWPPARPASACCAPRSPSRAPPHWPTQAEHRPAGPALRLLAEPAVVRLLDFSGDKVPPFRRCSQTKG